MKENSIQIWKCPIDSCNHEEIKVKRTNNNMIKSKIYEKIIIHFLKHLKKDNIYFGSTDLYKIFEENIIGERFYEEDLRSYDGDPSHHKWQTNLRSVLDRIIKNERKYIETDEIDTIPEEYNNDIIDKRKRRTRKRTEKFFQDYHIYDDWELYKIEKILPVSRQGNYKKQIPDDLEIYTALDKKNREKFANPSIELLKLCCKKNPKLNYERIREILLLILRKMYEINLQKSLSVIVSTASIIWHNVFNRPGDKDYIMQEPLILMVDGTLSSVRYLRRELNIEKRSYANIRDFIHDLNETIEKKVENIINSNDVEYWEDVRNFIIKGIIQRKRVNQSVIETSTFLYFNKSRAFSKNELWEVSKRVIEYVGDTPGASYHTELSRYSDNSDAGKKRSPLLFNIVNLSEKPYKIQLLESVRIKIDEFLELKGINEKLSPRQESTKKDEGKKIDNLLSTQNLGPLINKLKYYDFNEKFTVEDLLSVNSEIEQTISQSIIVNFLKLLENPLINGVKQNTGGDYRLVANTDKIIDKINEISSVLQNSLKDNSDKKIQKINLKTEIEHKIEVLQKKLNVLVIYKDKWIISENEIKYFIPEISVYLSCRDQSLNREFFKSEAYTWRRKFQILNINNEEKSKIYFNQLKSLSLSDKTHKLRDVNLIIDLNEHKLYYTDDGGGNIDEWKDIPFRFFQIKALDESSYKTLLERYF